MEMIEWRCPMAWTLSVLRTPSIPRFSWTRLKGATAGAEYLLRGRRPSGLRGDNLRLEIFEEILCGNGGMKKDDEEKLSYTCLTRRYFLKRFPQRFLALAIKCMYVRPEVIMRSFFYIILIFLKKNLEDLELLCIFAALFQMNVSLYKIPF